MIIAEAYAYYFEETEHCYAVWGEKEECGYPAPNLEGLLTRSSLRRDRIEPFLSVLRHPGPYDGSLECSFERTIRPAIRLLFSRYSGTS